MSEVTLDPYGYTYNNPINLTDPTGMSAEDSKGGGWFSRAWSAVKNTFSSSSEAEDMTVLDEIVISATGQRKEERVEQKQFNQVLSNIKQRQTIEEWRNIGIWDDNISYDNRAHALGSQLTLAMPSARFNGLFGLFSKGPKGSLSIQKGGSFSASEIEAAKYMQNLGNKVVLRSPTGTRAAGGTSDLLVNNVNFDVYTPTTSNVGRVISAIAKKNSQTQGIVLDLSQTSINAKQLENILQRVQGAGAKNIKDIVIMPK